jgi:hypothetical protein
MYLISLLRLVLVIVTITQGVSLFHYVSNAINVLIYEDGIKTILLLLDPT